MQKKIKSRLSSTFFVLTCICGCAASLLYFFYDLNKVSIKEEQQIAVIQFKRKIAQRRFSDSVVWERLAQNSPLYNEDLISTDNGAYATLVFNTGTSINVDENTMIQIYESEEGDLSLNVTGGSVDIDTTSSTAKTTIDFDNGVKIELDKGTKVSASAKEQMTDFVIHQGNAKTINKDGSQNEIKEGQSIKIDSDGNAKENLLFVKDFSQNEQVYVVEGSSKTIDFNFNKDSSFQNQKIVFETSETPDFKNISSIQEVDSVAQITVQENSKNFYYRAYLKNNNQAQTFGKISLLKIPDQNQKKESIPQVFNTSQDKTNISLNWQEFEHSDYTTIEIYKISDSKNINQDLTSKNLVLQKNVFGNALNVPDVKEGMYAYKIIPHYPMAAVELNNKQPEIFYVNKVEKILEPILLLPKNNSNVELKEKQNELTRVVFNWKCDSSNPIYNFQLSLDKDFNEVVFEQELEQPLFIFETNKDFLSKVNYFWRVQLKEDGFVKSTSKTNYFSIKQNWIDESFATQEFVFDNLSNKLQDVAVIEQQKLNEEKIQEPNDATNKVAKVQVKKRPKKKVVIQPTKIELVEPVDNTVIDGLEALKKPIIFEFKEDSLKKKKQFILTKLESDGSSRIVSAIDNPTRNVKIERLSSGNYTWTIKATLSDNTDVSPEKRFNFSVTRVEPLLKLELIEPINNFLINSDYLKNNRKISFTWQKVENATEYKFALYQKNKNGTLKLIVSKDVTQNKFDFKDLPILDIGKFQWKVKPYSKAKDGFVYQEGEESTFNFEINFDLPTQVKTIEQERMYGN